MHFDNSDINAKEIWELFEKYTPTIEDQNRLNALLNRYRKSTILDAMNRVNVTLDSLKEQASTYFG